MDLMNGINLYTLKSTYIKKVTKKETLGGEQENKTIQKTQHTKETAPNNILDFMENQCISVKADVKKTLKVCKITDSSQYQRISDMMKDFESEVESGLVTFNGEFPNIKISEESKMKFVLNSLERTYL